MSHTANRGQFVPWGIVSYPQHAALEMIRKTLHGVITTLIWVGTPRSGVVEYAGGACGSATISRLFDTFTTWEMDRLIFEDGGAWLEEVRLLKGAVENYNILPEIEQVWEVLRAREKAVKREKKALLSGVY
ncbi:hypothetical protein B0T21DRAFT_412123 [Apiosordaria backusii]|uniref:Uncharacterized protein n=1 Tax=Apiosordaria backusii TaxID=314023 RepID=A0AA40EEJ8_9PEZI|nr:hypothetical protein B0T21DRAFT_412123 [Apiosordaria backusii]